MENGKERIIEKIMLNTTVSCEKIISDASAYAKSAIGKAKEEIEIKKQKLTEKSAVDKAVFAERKIAVAKLDAKKYLLAEKRKLIDATFLEVATELKSAEYKEKLFAKLLRENAEQNEIVVAGKHDVKLLTQAFLDKFNLSLKLSKEAGDFDDGLKLIGNGYEKDLTFAT
ncbi:MAG: hypothetical protein RR086_02140, partial [Clostridia bacterium]